VFERLGAKARRSVLAPPKLEYEQSPERLAMIGAAAAMLFEHSLHVLRREQAVRAK
jgi:hypothetical protein